MQPLTTLEELIGSHPFLAGLDAKFVDIFSSCGSLRRFGSRQHIFEEGAEADHFFLILSGKVNLQIVVPDHSPLSILTLGAGEALGWSWLFAPHRWLFTAMTAAPTEVISFGAAFLRQKVGQDVGFANELLRRVSNTLVARLQITRRELIELSSSIPARGPLIGLSNPSAAAVGTPL
ncbi:MAG TPA: cyclic nucleotide-binding domain-containing protein [Candidatus Limnocylindrales bacterium]|jgi:CRP-like cAMP-binding protein|nr:cyclic nucleotide-binding domain-containing protein [Candidatus Limnocylindrales bacterium]